MKRQRIRAKQKQLITEELQASGKNAVDNLNINFEIPVYNSVEDVPDEEEGSIVFVNGQGLLIEDGT